MRFTVAAFCLALVACTRPSELPSSQITAAPEVSDAAPGGKSKAGFALGLGHACAWTGDGKGKCWGSNSHGQLGDGTKNTSTIVGVVPFDDIVEMSAGYGFSCARRSNGTVSCWGDNYAGKMGADPKTKEQLKPTPVMGLTAVAQIVTSSVHSCARHVDGSLTCWGDGGSGQLSGVDAHGIRKIASLGDAMQVAVGNGHSCALSTDGNVRCWGRNDNGQLGFGGVREQAACGQPGAPMIEVVDPSWSPKPVVVTVLKGATQIAATADHTCGRFANGTVKCTQSPLSLDPDTAASKLTAVAQLAAGTRHLCARHDDGTISCFGTNEHGELGNGTKSYSHKPVLVVGLKGTTDLRCGNEFCCARKADGAVACWGKNLEGELGDGTTTDRSTPVAVAYLLY